MSRESRKGELIQRAEAMLAKCGNASEWYPLSDKTQTDVLDLASDLLAALKASASWETGEHICPKCGLRVEPHRCGGEDAAF